MMLQLQQVCKTYGGNPSPVHAVSDVSIDLDKGDFVAVQGPSGCGKSTVLLTAGGLLQPDSGTVRVAGTNPYDLSPDARASFRAGTIGFVFQQFHLMAGLSALENIALPLELQNASDALERARGALEQVGLADRANHLPSRLSGGECQRVAIARAMVVEPALLLADEPSGSIDVRTGRTVMNLLFDLVQRVEMTLVLVTHSQELAAACDRGLELVSGRLA